MDELLTSTVTVLKLVMSMSGTHEVIGTVWGMAPTTSTLKGTGTLQPETGRVEVRE